MFRRGSDHSSSRRPFRPTSSDTSQRNLLVPSLWKTYHHFMFVYLALRDLKYMEKGTLSEAMESEAFVSETGKSTNAAMGWFPDIVLGLNKDISTEGFSEEYGKIIDYVIKTFHYESSSAKLLAQFNESIEHIKLYLDNSKEKLELVLEDLWDIATADNNLEGIEREMFITASEIFNISVNIE